MAIMADIATSVLGTIVGYTVIPIGRQFGYLFCYNDNMEKLRSESVKLKDESLVVHGKVEADTRSGQRIKPNVEKWLISVKQKQNEAAAILDKKENVGKGCLNLKSRYWESRKATKRSQELGKLLGEGEKFDKVSDPPLPLGIVVPEQSPIVVETQGDGISEVAASYAATPVPDQIGGSSSEGLDSRSLIMRVVMEAVKDDKIRMIGIWGMGGVGKTTIVEEVERRAKLDKSMFDEVVMTAVSKDPDVKKIQDDIAELLGLEFKEQNLRARAIRLHGRLTQTPEGSNIPKRILIILDDVWDKLNLKEVGIPYEDSDHNGCKIVLTSREKNVCEQMKTNKIFPVEVLPPREARFLFRKINDYSLSASTDLHGIAEDIVKECGGLPIAITNIANALIKQGEATWKDVHRQLKNSELDELVHKTLKVSYDFLKSKEIKDFFLLCCLFPEDFNISIEDLVRYGMGLRLFDRIDNLQDARNRAHAHVEKLMNSNLLLIGGSGESVKMHDLVRDFALSITKNGEGEHVFMVKFDNRSKVRPIQTCTSISFECDEMHELLDGLKCPNLKLLRLVRRNVFQSFKFPETIYEGMEKLQVLALTIPIQSLPGSLKLLTNLRTLSLDYCKFIDNISMIENLVNLEILSFVKSDIKELPREIGKLTRLKLLDLTGCTKLRKIAPGVLQSLICLEELYMMYSSFLWAQQAYVDDGTNASFDELKQLTNLVNIEIDIPYEVLPIDLTLENLENFKISIGHDGIDLMIDFHSVIENSLELRADRSVRLEGVIHVLCNRTKVLYLKVKDLKNLANKLERDGFFKLRRLTLDTCNELVSIVNSSSNLEDICGGQYSKQNFNIPSSSMHQPAPFGNLQDLKLRGCNKLKSVFPLCIARGLIELKSLEISHCHMMEEIFFKDRGDEDEKAVGKIVFPQLNRLDLEGLPNLIGFCKAVEEVELPQLEYLRFSGLPKLTSLYPDETETLAWIPKHPFFNKKVKLNKVTELKVSGMKNLIEIWPAQDSISELRRMQVDDCERVLNVFPSNMIQGLHNLEFLQVTNCGSVEVVFDLQGLNNKEQSHEVQVLSQLKAIYLENLPNLKHVWKRGSGGFQNLTSLHVERCERLETVFSPSIARRLVTLQTLYIIGCEMMESILSNDSGEDENGAAVPPYKIEFPKLEELYLEDLPNLVCFSKSADGVELPQLEDWRIVKVPKFAGLYPEEETLTLNSKVTLTNLESLYVEGVDCLTTVFPALVIRHFLNLGVLNLQECNSVEVVFDLEGLNVNEGRELVPLTRLKKLLVWDLPKLTHVWKKGPHMIQGFQNLTTLNVWNCDSLRHLFTPSIAKIVVGLQDLHISNCKLLEAIVAKEEGGEDEEEGILFPQLTGLHLNRLPNLLTLTPKWLNWSSLKELTMDDCGKESGTLTHTLHVSDIGQQVTVTKVAKVSGKENPNEISPAQCDTQVSREATNCERQILTPLPTNVIQQLHNLVNLILGHFSSVEVVFGLKGLHGRELAALTQLRTVALWDLPKLTHVWKKSVHITRDFQNLTRLEVSGCDSLKHVFTYSMAKILVGLEDLHLSDCELLEAIVAKDEEEEEEDCTMKERILFPHLTKLYLRGLPNLLTIPYTFNWSSSTDLTMNDRLREGDTAQQDLTTVFDLGRSSIEVVFDILQLNVNEGREVVRLTQFITKLTLRELPKLTHVWKTGPHIIQGFQNLKTLSVVKCDSLRHLFTPSIAKILVGLQKLRIADCELFEAIVAKEEGGEEEEDCTTKEGILLPQLTRLSLSGLPNLWTITPKAYTFNWSFLVHCDVKDCGEGEKILNDIIGNHNTPRLPTEGTTNTEEDREEEDTEEGTEEDTEEDFDCVF